MSSFLEVCIGVFGSKDKNIKINLKNVSTSVQWVLDNIGDFAKRLEYIWN